MLHLLLVFFVLVNKVEFYFATFGLLNTFSKHTGVHLDLVFLQEQLKRSPQFFVKQGEHRVHRFNDGDFRPEHAERDAKFKADVASSNDNNVFR